MTFEESLARFLGYRELRTEIEAYDSIRVIERDRMHRGQGAGVQAPVVFGTRGSTGKRAFREIMKYPHVDETLDSL